MPPGNAGRLPRSPWRLAVDAALKAMNPEGLAPTRPSESALNSYFPANAARIRTQLRMPLW